MEQYEAAVLAFEDAVVATPDDDDAWAGLGIARYHLNDHHAAVRALVRARDLSPNTASYHAWLGRVFFQARDFEQSRRAYRAALDLDPNDAAAQDGYRLAVAARRDDPGGMSAPVSGALIGAAVGVGATLVTALVLPCEGAFCEVGYMVGGLLVASIGAVIGALIGWGTEHHAEPDGEGGATAAASDGEASAGVRGPGTTVQHVQPAFDFALAADGAGAVGQIHFAF